MIQQEKMRAEFVDFGRVVGCNKNGLTESGKREDKVVKVRQRSDIESGRWFIEQQELGIVGDGRCKQRTLMLTGRQRGGIAWSEMM